MRRVAQVPGCCEKPAPRVMPGIGQRWTSILQTRIHSARDALMVKGDLYPEKLMRPNEPAPRRSAAGPPKGQDAGAIVRAARLAAGLTLADLGRRCNYSASQVSRYERGIQPLTDIGLLRRFSQVLAIPPQAFGLAPPDSSRAGRHAVEPKDGDLASAGLG
jgi:hypothetical protein